MKNLLKSFLSSLYFRCNYLLQLSLGKEKRWQVDYKCEMLALGTYDGRWFIHPKFYDSSGIVYSFGVGKDISFDLELIKRYNFEIHAFDPTPTSVQWLAKQLLPSGFHFHPYGLADYDGTAEFTLPANHSVSFTMLNTQQGSSNKLTRGKVLKLSTIMRKLGHKKIDICKMDIEGAEYGVIDDIIEQRENIGQLLIEFHHRLIDNTQGLEMTNKAVTRLNEAGFSLVHVSRGLEFSFLNNPGKTAYYRQHT